MARESGFASTNARAGRHTHAHTRARTKAGRRGQATNHDVPVLCDFCFAGFHDGVCAVELELEAHALLTLHFVLFHERRYTLHGATLAHVGET